MGRPKDCRSFEIVVADFWKMVRVGRDDECWPWLGKTSSGYGYLWVLGKRWTALRFLASSLEEAGLICRS